MIHEEKDYDISKIPEDEPIFLLRGKDPHAEEVILFWLQLNHDSPHGSGIIQSKWDSVVSHAKRMHTYYREEIR